jgi:hypothetical protein
MANFYRINIGSIYLTSTGLAGGIPCKLEVPAADSLFDNFAQNVIIANDGTVIVQNFEISQGKQIDILVEVMPKTVWESLLSARNTALTNSATLNIIGTGDTGNFDVTAIPLKFSAKRFRNSRIYEVNLSFITVS